MLYRCILYRNDGTDSHDGEVNHGSERILVMAPSPEEAGLRAEGYWHREIDRLADQGFEPGIGTDKLEPAVQVILL